MSNVNDFLPFCYDDTGTNLIGQSAYVASAARPIGNQPGIASSQLNNKALRQGTYVVSQLAQFISNYTVTDVLDNDVPAQLLSQMMSTFQPLAPVLTQFLSGTGTWNATVAFFCASANATTGATYTNNGVTYTVSSTISSGLVLKATGNGAPTANGGVLTKASGTGDSAITFYAFRKALHLTALMVGGGGGGSAYTTGASPGASGSDGTDTTFGTSLLVAGHGSGASGGGGGLGGSASLGTGPVGLALPGGSGTGSGQAIGSNVFFGSAGASTPLSGGGSGGDEFVSGNGNPANPNSGAGGGGAYASGAGGTATSGGGGGAGGYINGIIFNPLYAYAYSVGTGGTGGSGGANGGNGGSGLIQIIESFQ